MANNDLIAPVVKWVGGKRQLMSDITPLLPKRITSYCEPFLGGGALLFFIKPKCALLNDLNGELISMYEVIRDDVEGLISDLKEHQNNNEYFINMRNMDRDKDSFNAMSKLQRASRLIYLNKTCYNGLYRVNLSGQFNTPFGKYKKPNIINESVLRAVSAYFQKNEITFCNEDFASTLCKVPDKSFVYLDPPYDPMSSTASFTRYNNCGFSRQDQIRLKECCDELNERGIKFMLSNSATQFIKDLYGDYKITIVKAKRTINSKAHKRGLVDEVLITNYKTRA